MENKQVRQTSGGEYLRELRERAGLSQRQVADWSGVENYAKYEIGERPNPKRETVIQILDALASRFSERKEALHRFSFVTDTPEPTDEDIAWACSKCQPIMDAVPFPSYLLDVRAYVLAWNKQVPKMFGLRSSTLQFFLGSQRMTLFQTFFHPRLRFADAVENRDMVLKHVIQLVRQDFAQYMKEPWSKRILDESFKMPEFKKYWDIVPQLPPSDIPARPLTHLRIRHKDSVVAFRVAIERMTRDERFKIVYLMPADVHTTELCETWQKEAA